jgi:hypothetical protein
VAAIAGDHNGLYSDSHEIGFAYDTHGFFPPNYGYANAGDIFPNRETYFFF